MRRIHLFLLPVCILVFTAIEDIQFPQTSITGYHGNDIVAIMFGMFAWATLAAITWKKGS